MAMLAEKRRRNKFVLTPVSKPLWTSDTNGTQFGKKLMEKMGWSAGKGLGATEQGIAEPLRAVYKQDSKGMGYSGNGNPFENLDQFNALLSSLSGETPDPEVVHSFESLEEKSKQSRSRVHYKKFTRGKDLSKYSNVDLTCIVGTGKKPEEEVEVEELPDRTGETENSHGVTTINSGSIADYFKLKREQLKAGGDQGRADYENSGEKFDASELEENAEANLEESSSRKSHRKNHKETRTDGVEDCEDIENSKKAKKRKRKELEEVGTSEEAVGDQKLLKVENEEGTVEIPDAVVLNCDPDQETNEERSKKKKKKRKDREISEVEPIGNSVDQNDSEIRTKQKKSKRKENSHREELTDEPCVDQEKGELVPDQDSNEERSKKKKKKRKDRDISEVTTEELVEPGRSSADQNDSEVGIKEKKSKRKECARHEEKFVAEEENELLSKKKKKRKENTDLEETVEGELMEEDVTPSIKREKRKKSKRKEKDGDSVPENGQEEIIEKDSEKGDKNQSNIDQLSESDETERSKPEKKKKRKREDIPEDSEPMKEVDSESEKRAKKAEKKKKRREENQLDSVEEVVTNKKDKTVKETEQESDPSESSETSDKSKTKMKDGEPEVPEEESVTIVSREDDVTAESKDIEDIAKNFVGSNLMSLPGYGHVRRSAIKAAPLTS